MTIDAKSLNRLIKGLGSGALSASPRSTTVERGAMTERAFTALTDESLRELALVGATQKLLDLEREAAEVRELIRQISGHKSRGRVSNGVPERTKRGKRGKRTPDPEATAKTVRFVESRGPTTPGDVAKAFDITRIAANLRLIQAVKLGKIKRKTKGVYEAK